MQGTTDLLGVDNDGNTNAIDDLLGLKNSNEENKVKNPSGNVDLLDIIEGSSSIPVP